MYPECRHILPRGAKCKSPALRGKAYCYFHYHLQRFEQDGQRQTHEPLCLPPLEDAHGIQMALGQILAALGSGRLDTRKVGLYLYGMQLATQLLAQLPITCPEEMVCALACDAGGNSIAAEETPDQEIPAPEVAAQDMHFDPLLATEAKTLRLAAPAADPPIESEPARIDPQRRAATG